MDPFTIDQGGDDALPYAIHVGRNIKRFRVLRDLSQKGLGLQLGKLTGEDWDQQRVSTLEARPAIEDRHLLRLIGESLNISMDILEQFPDDGVINIVGNTFHDYSQMQNASYGHIHNEDRGLLEKVVAIFEKERNDLKDEIKRLQEEVANLKRGK